MEEQAILEQLLGLLEENHVTVRTESVGGGGAGLCTIRGKKVFFVDKNASPCDVAVIYAHAVHETVDIDKIYLKPQVREFLEGNRPVK